MSREAVEHILRDIDTLDDQELLAVDHRLALRLREQWDSEVLAARQEAKHRQIDQSKIDEVIERRRYGQ